MEQPGVIKQLRKNTQRVWWALRIRKERLRARLHYRFPGIFSAQSITPKSTLTAPLAGRFCPNPFKQIDLEEGGIAFACCSSWLPTPMGNLKSSSLMEMWNGNAMQKIRESIFDGSFRYCRHDRCPMIQNGSLPTLEEAARDPLFTRVINEKKLTVEHPPQFVNLVNDRSCNLYCPSCRTKRINVHDGSEYEEIASLQERLLEPYLATPNDRSFVLSITGSGDPFASRVYRELLYSTDGSKYPNMKIALQTNGVLLTPRIWERMKGIHQNISTIIISFDAATEPTYNITRRGGHWPTLLENSERMGALRKAGDVKYLRFDYVAQKANFREMVPFVELCRSFGADRAYFSRVTDWGTWSKDTFMDQCVWEPGHPLHDEFTEIMRNPIFDDPFVDMGNMTEIRQHALQSEPNPRP